MRVRLKGINSVSKRLADGTTRTYWYAWKGGPPLRGEPRHARISPQLQRGRSAQSDRPARHDAQPVAGLPAKRRNSSVSARARAAATTSNRSRRSKNRFQRLPLAALSDRRTRGIFKQWRDQLALKSRRQADYAWQVLTLIFSRSARPWIDHAQPVHPSWSTLPQHAHRENLEERRRDGVSQIRPRRICICRYCSRCGPASARAISCACRGPPTTAHTYD